MGDGGLCIWWPLDAIDSMGIGFAAGMLTYMVFAMLWSALIDWRETRALTKWEST